MAVNIGEGTNVINLLFITIKNGKNGYKGHYALIKNLDIFLAYTRPNSLLTIFTIILAFLLSNSFIIHHIDLFLCIKSLKESFQCC